MGKFQEGLAYRPSIELDRESYLAYDSKSAVLPGGRILKQALFVSLPGAVLGAEFNSSEPLRKLTFQTTGSLDPGAA